MIAVTDAKCAYCYSTNVSIIGSYEDREVIVVQCYDCGKRSELDTENDHADAGPVSRVTPP